jgi:hypothetical protein
MADFYVVPGDPTVDTGTVTEMDVTLGLALPRPSRFNPIPGRPLQRYIAQAGGNCYFSCLLNGQDSPVPDASLGGRLFTAWVMESPVAYPLAVTAPIAGASSSQLFVPPTSGHYLLCFSRPAGGSILVHLDAYVVPS